MWRINPLETAILDCTVDRASAFRSLALWNELLETVWPGAASSQPAREDLSTAFHILKNAFEEMSSAAGSLLGHRDAYWDAMETVRKRLVGKEETP